MRSQWSSLGLTHWRRECVPVHRWSGWVLGQKSQCRVILPIIDSHFLFPGGGVYNLPSILGRGLEEKRRQRGLVMGVEYQQHPLQSILCSAQVQVHWLPTLSSLHLDITSLKFQLVTVSGEACKRKVRGRRQISAVAVGPKAVTDAHDHIPLPPVLDCPHPWQVLLVKVVCLVG